MFGTFGDGIRFSIFIGLRRNALPYALMFVAVGEQDGVCPELHRLDLEKTRRDPEFAGQKSKRTVRNTKGYQTQNLIALNYGGDDRIRTCGSLLDYNDLANRRFQPLSHVSGICY